MVRWRVERRADHEHVELVGHVVGLRRGSRECLAEVGDRYDDPAELQLAQRLEAVFERGHDAEVAAAAAQRPQELRIAVLAGSHDLAVGA